MCESEIDANIIRNEGERNINFVTSNISHLNGIFLLRIITWYKSLQLLYEIQGMCNVIFPTHITLSLSHTHTPSLSLLHLNAIKDNG